MENSKWRVIHAMQALHPDSVGLADGLGWCQSKSRRRSLMGDNEIGMGRQRAGGAQSLTSQKSPCL